MPPKRKRNVFVRYFIPFGLRQMCDMILLVGAIVTILGMILFRVTPYILPIGVGLFIVGGLIAVFRAVRVLFSGINRRSPEFKRAIVNTVIMGIFVAVSVAAMLYYFLEQMV